MTKHLFDALIKAELKKLKFNSKTVYKIIQRINARIDENLYAMRMQETIDYMMPFFAELMKEKIIITDEIVDNIVYEYISHTKKVLVRKIYNITH